MIQYTKIIRYGILALALSLSAGIMPLSSIYAQEAEAKPATTKRVRESGRDPFRKYEPKIVAKRTPDQVAIPSIQERIAQYKAQKLAAMTARMVAPKPTTALLLSEIQVVGISKSPRGFAAIVQAKPIKLSYVIYPGERLYDGQLVAIEETRLIFRRETVFLDGRRERSVEYKPLQQADPDLMTSAQTAPTSSAKAESGKSSDQSTAPKP